MHNKKIRLKKWSKWLSAMICVKGVPLRGVFFFLLYFFFILFKKKCAAFCVSYERNILAQKLQLIVSTQRSNLFYI